MARTATPTPPPKIPTSISLYVRNRPISAPQKSPPPHTQIAAQGQPHTIHTEMVTGIEVAGLVLAVFPIVVNAIDEYRQGLERMKDWWRYRTKFIALARDIDTQDLIFQENIELLLSPVVSDDVEMDALVNDPAGPEWAKPDLRERLMERLPKSFDAYIAIVQEMNRILEELQTHLGIVDGKVPWTKSSLGWRDRCNNHLIRIRLSLDQEKLKKLVAELAARNNTLMTLLDSSERLGPIRARRTAEIPASWKKVRDRATSLFTALASSWGCGCATPHYVNMQLHSFSTPHVETGSSSGKRDPSFILWFVEKYGVEGILWGWHHVEVRTSYYSFPRNPERSSQKDSIASRKDSALSKSEDNRPPVKRRKLLKTLQRPSAVRRRTVSFSEETRVEPPRYSVNRELHEIRNLCATLTKCHGTVSSVGFVACQKGFRHELYSAPQYSDTFCLNGVSSLSDLLLQSSKSSRFREAGKRFKLSRKQRMILALQISTSLLQLYDTPWISTDWSEKHIIFQGADSLSKLNLCQPYLRQEVPIGASNTFGNTKDMANDTEAIIFRLGVLLLELCTGQPLENELLSNDYPSAGQTYISEFKRVYQWWARDARDEEGEVYAEAIRQCIQFDFPTESRSLRDKELVREVYNCVVQPIAEVVSKFKM